MFMKMKCVLIVFVGVLMSCEAQWAPSIPLSQMSFQELERAISGAPPGRSPVIEDIIIRHYSTDVMKPTSRRIGNIKQLLKDPEFDPRKPTVVYAHGYVELLTDISVASVMSSYIQRGGYNVLLVDWSNLALGNYFLIAKSLPSAGEQLGKALFRLLKKGLSLEGLHLVGHSMGCHLVGYAGRYLAARNYKVPRITALDPAYPGFYPPILAPHLEPSDAVFVDVIHTDAGYYGAPGSTGHADFWPNGGNAKQPGCTTSIPLTYEDFCSHFRSWQIWTESLSGEGFLARKCESYDMFLRGDCQDQPTVLMGLNATSDLRGNFYLRTATKPPYNLGIRGIS